LHGRKVLFSSEDKPAGEYKTTEQQQAETRERGDISRAANLCVELMLRKSFHVRFPSLRNLAFSAPLR
jgi:cytochrome c peroxidase